MAKQDWRDAVEENDDIAWRPNRYLYKICGFSELPGLQFLGHLSEKTWRGLQSGLKQKGGCAGADISSLLT